MKPTLKVPLLLLVLLLGGLVIVRLWDRGETTPPGKPEIVRQEPSPVVPALLPARAGTAENPLQSWERLLVEDGPPAEDRAALADIVINYLQSAPHQTRPPLGTNDEITRALTDRDTLGDSAIPTTHPAIVSGQLVDRWGSPWFFHQLSADVIEVRSAGPDRKLFTVDDVVK